MFHSFLTVDSKQDDVTSAATCKHIIKLLKQRKIMSSKLSTLWENTDGRAENYRCATSLFLLSILSQDFYLIIDHGVSAPGNFRDVVDGLNATEKRFIFQSISTVQLLGAKGYYTQILMHSATYMGTTGQLLCFHCGNGNLPLR